MDGIDLRLIWMPQTWSLQAKSYNVAWGQMNVVSGGHSRQECVFVEETALCILLKIFCIQAHHFCFRYSFIAARNLIAFARHPFFLQTYFSCIFQVSIAFISFCVICKLGCKSCYHCSRTWQVSCFRW